MSEVPGHQTMTSPPLVRIESGSVGSGETLNVHKRGYDEEQVISMSEIESKQDFLSTSNQTVREGFKKRLIEFSIKGWLGGSGGDQILFKKMPLKSILGHFKPF